MHNTDNTQKVADLSWARIDHPLFRKMVAETQRRLEDQKHYKENPGYESNPIGDIPHVKAINH